MPKKTEKKSGKRKKFVDWKNTKWCLNNLDDDMLAQIDSMHFDTERYMDWVSHLVDNGMELKLGFDDWSECYVGTLIGGWEGFVNTGYAVSARSDEDFVDVIKILWGKYEFIAQGDLSAVYETPPKKSRKRG